MRVLIFAVSGILISLLFICVVQSQDVISTHNQIISISLDLQESRRREEILGQAVKDLSYQIDVLAQRGKI